MSATDTAESVTNFFVRLVQQLKKAVPKQLNPFFETMITTESLHKLANFRNTKENLQIKRYYSNCLFTAATIDSNFVRLSYSK